MIKTVGDLKNILKNIDDDFKLNIRIERELSEEELKDSGWGYFIYDDAIIEFDDVGYSDKVIAFSIIKKTGKK